MRRTRRILAAAMSLLSAVGVAAIVRPAAAVAATPTQYVLMNLLNLQCLQENGTTSSVYLGGCTENHSAIWTRSALGGYALKNLHSGLCLSVTGAQPGVYMHACGTNTTTSTAQEWAFTDYGPIGGPLNVGGHDLTGDGGTLTNRHSGLRLYWKGTSLSAVQQASSGADFADLWGLLVV
jgi:hypothetical protein